MGTGVTLYVPRDAQAARMAAQERYNAEDLARWRAQMAPLAFARLLEFRDGEQAAGPQGELGGPFVKALWTISQERLADVSSAQSDRASMHRAQRQGLTVSDVRVVTLRRRDTSAALGAHHEVDWSHRWVVSGHWRNQYLPSVDAHRLQWVAEYVKGPGDRPLVIKDPIFRVAR